MGQPEHQEPGAEAGTRRTAGSATERGETPEGVNTVLLLTDEDDFNALASATLPDSVEGGVYRLGPPHHGDGVVAPCTGGEVLFGEGLTRSAMIDRHHDEARVVTRGADGPIPPGHDLLFLVHDDGRLDAVTEVTRPTPRTGDVLVLLGPAGSTG